jgi:hypothetical protein
MWMRMYVDHKQKPSQYCLQDLANWVLVVLKNTICWLGLRLPLNHFTRR